MLIPPGSVHCLGPFGRCAMCARNHEEVVGDGEGACWVALNDDGAGVLGRFGVRVRCSDDLSEGKMSRLCVHRCERYDIIFKMLAGFATS